MSEPVRVTLRIPEHLHEFLSMSANINDNSLNTEIVNRITSSFGAHVIVVVDSNSKKSLRLFEQTVNKIIGAQYGGYETKENSQYALTVLSDSSNTDELFEIIAKGCGFNVLGVTRTETLGLMIIK